jgi:hypothetical protein
LRSRSAQSRKFFAHDSFGLGSRALVTFFANMARASE